MNTFFVNIAESLDLKKHDDSLLNPINSENINDILEKQKNHPSLQEISQTFMANKNFSFKLMTEDLVKEEIMNLDGFKATPIVVISVDILKLTVHIGFPFITNRINLSIEKACFPEELKLAEVSPIFKKKDDLDKESYRPVSVLPHVPKVFERIMYHQINGYMKDKLSNN